MKSNTGQATKSRPPRTVRRPRFTFRRFLLGLLLLVSLSALVAHLIPCQYWVHGTGHIMTEQVVTLRPTVSGIIQRCLVDSDSQVNEGQLLIQLDDTVQRAALEEAQSQISARGAELQRFLKSQELERSERESQIQRAQLNLELADQFLRRLQSDASTVSKMQIDEAQLRQQLAASRLHELQLPRDELLEKQIAVLRERIIASQKQVPVLEAELKLRQIYSPLDGTVHFHSFVPGEAVKSEDEIGQIFNRELWIVSLKLPEREIARVQEGQPVRVALAAYPPSRHGYLHATVSRTDKMVTPQATGDAIFYAEAKIRPRDDIRLQPGMTSWAWVDAGDSNYLARLLNY